MSALPDITVIYEDNHLLVIEKPVNIPSQKDQSADPDLLTILKANLKERYQKPGNVYLGLVHRLDRPTGGVMVFAKTSKAASRLSESIRNGKWQKLYWAVVHHQPTPAAGKLYHQLWKDEAQNKVFVVPEHDKRGKPARLSYQTLDQKPHYSLVEIDLETGRPHQIRVQFAQIGSPLFGDQKYGSAETKVGQQLALWAVQLRFPHPTLPETVQVESKPPNTYPWNQFRQK